MGTPWMGFMQDEFGWSKNKGAWSFGALVLVMGLPTVIFYKEGLFDQYDYWAGTVSLVVFAFLETILFSYIFGIKKGWAEINMGADIKIPGIYKYIILIVTPALLGWVLISSIPDWIEKIKDSDTNNKEWFASEFYAENFESNGTVTGLVEEVTPNFVKFSFEDTKKEFDREKGTTKMVSFTNYKEYKFDADKNQIVTLVKGDIVKPNDVIATGDFTNDTLFKFIGRMLLLSLFAFISLIVYFAYKKRVREGRATV
jgi:hypothetical protein